MAFTEELKKYIATWKEFHGDEWEHKLWTDAEVAKITLDNQDLYDKATNYGMKSDILKWELVYRYGGVYVDVDFECLKPLDILHHTYDFYVGIQPLDTQFLQLGAALFGGVPGHPILKNTIETLRESFYSQKGTPARTGPIHFTKSFFKTAGKTGMRDIAFPAHYLYPLGAFDEVIDKDQWILDGAWAVHWWGKTWMPISYRAGSFRSIDNKDQVLDWNV